MSEDLPDGLALVVRAVSSLSDLFEDNVLELSESGF